MGCRLCEIHCLVEHSKSKDIIKAYKEEMPRALARIRVEEDKPISFALQCRHCDDAPCIKACITGAMKKSSEGIVTVDKEKCVGCWMCIMVCPTGAIERDLATKKIASKCDLCMERGKPVCVANCPNEALVYEER